MTLLNNIQYFSQDNTGHNIRMEFDLFIVHIDVISTAVLVLSSRGVYGMF